MTAADTLLVASDLSHRSDRAVARGFEIARRSGARLVLAHVVDDDLPEALADTLRDQAGTLLERIATAEAGGRNTPFETRVIQGDTVPALIALAGSVGAGTIVAGMHRERPFFDGLIETTVERLVRLADRPVLVVRDPADRAYGAVLVAVDGSPAAAEAARAAAALAPDATIRGFHAVHVPFRGFTDPRGGSPDVRRDLAAARRAVDEWGAREGLAALAARTEVQDGGLHEVLARVLAERPPDLLALGAHGRGGIAPALLGSFARDLMRAPPCDLLISHEP